jgi:DNA-binding NtrC family response regulator
MQPPIRVAVVDDNEDIRVLIGMHLELDDRFVCTALVGTGSEALDLVERTDIDAMILDMHMPGTAGNDVLRAMRLLHPGVRVVAFSADAYTLAAAAEQGAAATVLKGATLDGLVDALLVDSSFA